MPEIKSYLILNISQDWDALNSFLVNSIPTSQHSIRLVNFQLARPNLSIKFLSLREIASKTVNIFTLMRFKLSGGEFATIVTTSRNAKVLKFENCIIKTDYRLNFGMMRKWWIEELSFWEWEGKMYCNWNSQKSRLINIFNAISLCTNLRNSLQKICIWKSCQKGRIRISEFGIIHKFPNLRILRYWHKYYLKFRHYFIFIKNILLYFHKSLYLNV